ncbi:MAG TPA: hypothetical protein VGM39_01860 [Kofleriaceae bacterium]|jgi:hypothetical protein
MRSLLVVALLSSVAYAQEAPPAETPPAEVAPADALPALPPEPPKPAAFDATKHEDEPTLPKPTEASGVAIEEPVTGESGRTLARVVLFVPRWTFWAIAQPFRGLGWLYEHYSLQDRVKGVLFNYDGTYGVYPVARYSSDYGIDFGLRFVHYNLAGEHEKMRLRFDFGGEFQQAYGINLTSGNRFGKQFNISLESLYERRPYDRFFGIGNANEVKPTPTTPLDPSLANAASDSRFRQNWFHTALHFEYKPIQAVAFRLNSAIAIRKFENASDSDPFDPTDPKEGVDNGIEQRFDTSKLVGYDSGVKNTYFELEAIYDTRRPSGRFQPPVFETTGWYASVHAGHANGIDGDPTDFWRYGGEVQKLFDLYHGTRVLTLRAMMDAVAGGDGRTDNNISFIDLPRLGGVDWLRGYPDGRFRDKAVTLVTAEYGWDLGNFVSAYLFLDGGRTWSTLENVDPDSLHYGYGGGIELHTNDSFLMRGQLALSREGDVFFELALRPAFGRRERAGRY